MEPTSNHVLEVANLDAYYGKSHVIRSVSLSVGPGEVVALMGRNGAGKTTTMNAIAGLHANNTGQIRLNGRDISHRQAFDRVRAGLGLVPAGGRLFKTLSVKDNLLVVSGGEPTRRRSFEDVTEVFPALREIPERRAGALSGGERQMVAVARALMSGPVMLLMDEPSEGLAPLAVQALGTMIRQLRDAGLAILLCEQNHRFSAELADRVYFLEKGRVEAAAPTSDLVDGVLYERFLGV